MSAGFLAPTTVDGVVAALAADPAATIVAGGTDLLPAAAVAGRPLPSRWVAVHAVGELGEIAPAPDGGLRIGAASTHAAIAASAAVRARARAVGQAAALVGSPATRTVATIGGNLVNASPAMELGAPLLVHDASVVLAGPHGERRLGLDAFLVGPGRTALGPGELLTALLLPAAPPSAAGAYVRLGTRAAMDVATVAAAVLVACDPDGVVRVARIALAAVAPTCRRAPEAEALLVGRPLTAAAIAAAADAAAAHAAPIDDLRAPAAYRRALVAVAVRRALTEAAP
jgi:CO/xanthine dehydrogenase FAD-binding subunit